MRVIFIFAHLLVSVLLVVELGLFSASAASDVCPVDIVVDFSNPNMKSDQKMLCTTDPLSLLLFFYSFGMFYECQEKSMI